MSANNTTIDTIRADNPINSKAFDLLNRHNLASKIGATICNYMGQSSLAIGIYGKWGSGKTSFINMIIESIDTTASTNPKPIIVHFRPWYFSGQDQMLEQFFKQIGSEIQTSPDVIEGKLNTQAKEIVNMLTKFSKYMRYAKPFALTIGISPEVIDKLGDALSDITNDAPFDPHIMKSNIARALQELGRKVIIVIDDVDRLTKSEIRQIFQLVKALADFPNTIYLLSFDKDIVCKALIGVQTGHANEYLEKIIQIPFELPSISPVFLYQYLISNLEKIAYGGLNERNKEYWTEVYFYGLNRYLTNLREINRFLNVFEFEYSLLKNEVNIVDLIALTAIKSKDSQLYHYIYHNKQIFCGFIYETDNYNARAQRIMDKDGYYKSLKDSYIEASKEFHRIEDIGPVLTILFPHLKELLTGHSLNIDNSNRKLKKSQSIADPEHFDRFFYLTIPDGQISNIQLKEIICLQDRPEAFQAAVNKYNYEGKYTLIDLFCTNIEDFHKNNFLKVIKVLATVAENPENNKEDGFFSFTLFEFICQFINDLFKEGNTSIEEQLDLYKELFKHDTIGPFIHSRLLYKISDRIGASHQGEILRDIIENSQYKNAFFELESIMVSKIRILAENGGLQKHPNMLALLYTWNKVNIEEPKKFIEVILQTDDGVIDFVTSILSYSFRSNGKTPIIRKKYIEDFTNEAELKDKVKMIKFKSDYSLLSDKSRTAIETLLDLDTS